MTATTDNADLAPVSTAMIAEPVTGRVLITGGTGYVGANLRAALTGRPLRLLVRNATKARPLASDTVEIVEGDVTKPETLRGKLDGCDAVIHLVAIIEETATAKFDPVIHGGTDNILTEATHAGITRFLQMSALGAMDNPHYGYMKAKWDAEQVVKASGIPWTIFRPSVVFGPGDGFINPLAGLVKAPITPVVGDGQSKFMPVSVKEVAEAFAAALNNPATAGEIYELGGAKVYTFAEMLDAVGKTLGKKRPRIHVPVALLKPVVTLSQPLPKALRPPVTPEQIKMLALDNTTENNRIAELIGREPMALEDGLDYLLPGAVNHPPK